MFIELSFGGTGGPISLWTETCERAGTQRQSYRLPKPDAPPAALFSYKLPDEYLTCETGNTINEGFPAFLCPFCLENPLAPPALAESVVDIHKAHANTCARYPHVLFCHRPTTGRVGTRNACRGVYKRSLWNTSTTWGRKCEGGVRVKGYEMGVVEG